MDLKKILENNGKLLAVLYIILLLIILFVIFEQELVKAGMLPENNINLFNIENFTQQRTCRQTTAAIQTNNNTQTNTISNINMVKPIHNILISFTNENLYYGTYLSYTSGDHNDNFLYTMSLESNKWIKPSKNLELSDEHIIIDLTYDGEKHLTAVGLKMNNNEPEYDIFKKQSSELSGEWDMVESNKKIRSLCNDLKTGILLGCSSYDGQIYESKNKRLSYGDWVGPINYDIPMRKVMFDKEGIMIGIGLIDNYIYRKKDEYWRETKWDKKNMNKTKVFDLIYDKDGCLIATTSEGIKKQRFPDFGSEFVLLKDFDQEHEEILDLNEIIKFKTGNEYIDNDFDLSTELGRDLKRIYEFKKVSKDLCSNKPKLNRGTINPDKENVDTDTLNRQNEEINELYDRINNLSNKLGL